MIEELDSILQHHGIKGMHWGIHRKRNDSGGGQPTKQLTPDEGGKLLKKLETQMKNTKDPAKLKSLEKAYGKIEDSINYSKPKTHKNGIIKQHINSIKREQHWHKVLKDVNSMTTKEIYATSNRIQLENELKRLSKSKIIGSAKDKNDYLLRANMSDEELKRKVTRLRAKESLVRNVSDVTKKQRQFGERVTKTARSLAINSAVKGKLNANDVYDSVVNPNKAKSELMRSVSISAIDTGMKIYKQYSKAR